MHSARARARLLAVLIVVAAACSKSAPTAPTAPTPAAPTPLSISVQPANQTIDAGGTATLAVVASGSAPLAYQWHAGTSGNTTQPISGATAASYTTPALASTTSYWVRVSDRHGTADSATATVTVTPPPEPPPGPSPPPDPPPPSPPDPAPPPPPPPPPPEPPPPSPVAPVITAHPENRSIASGQTATLAVQASGTAPLGYQWFVGASGDSASPVNGATSASFTTPALTQTTTYWVRVSNAAGSADSATATVAVTGAETNPAFEEQVVVLVNQYRAAGATCGGTYYGPVPGLAMNAALGAAARGHSQDMAVNDYFSHTSLDGRTFDQRISAAGYSGAFPWGENIAAGQSTPEEVVTGWMASPGHCTNIMSSGYKAIGVGYAFRAGSTYRHYWTQDFGGG